MTNKIYCLVDYKNRFGSKFTAKPYRSGMDKNVLSEQFLKYDVCIEYIEFSEVYFRQDWKGKLVIYTSQEDVEYHYKSYIEDIVYGLELAGAIVIPSYKYLKANNNKVFMEILRDIIKFKGMKGIESRYYGCYEEIEGKNMDFPVVLKTASGAMSRGVTSASSKFELSRKIKKISRTNIFPQECIELIRELKHRGYKRESKYRSKFIVQNMIPNLANDFKVLVYGNKIYYLKREVRDNDFRASGSGKFNFTKECPKGMLEYAYEVFKALDVPNLSIDICFDGNSFHIIEFQAVYFGTTTIEKSPFYCLVKDKDNFEIIDNVSILENVYVESIVKYIRKLVEER